MSDILSVFLKSLDEARMRTTQPVERVWMNVHTRTQLTADACIYAEWREGPVITHIYGCEISIDEKLSDGTFDFRVTTPRITVGWLLERLPKR